jgi:3-hydroxybutyryl-CoA dehydrogenase
LGRGIAACLLAHGFRVIAFTRKQATYQKARDYIGRAIAELVEKADFPAELGVTLT